MFSVRNEFDHCLTSIISYHMTRGNSYRELVSGVPKKSVSQNPKRNVFST